MKIFASLAPITLIFAVAFSACTPRINQETGILSDSSSTSSSTSVSNSPKSASKAASETEASETAIALERIELFTMDDLFNQGGGGCGMTLWKQEDGLRPPGYLFYNRLAQQAGDEFTLMRIDGRFVRLQRTSATGQAFYGQHTSQTFVSQDGSTQVQVNVQLGQPGEIESFAVEGILSIQFNNQPVEIPVQGSAGC